MIATDENCESLRSLLRPYQIDVSEQQAMLMLRHLDLVVGKNKVMNLTRIVEPHDAIVRHVVDSLLLVPSLARHGCSCDSRLVDIGTGAGFPGLPIGIVTGVQGLLIDSVDKKVRAVNDFVEALGMSQSLSVMSIRAEDLARQRPQSFDYVVARAVADLGVLLEYASPLLRKDGYLIVSKAHISDDEIERGQKTAQLVGMRPVSRETYELPDDQGHREILAYQRSGKSKVKLPRQTGLAKKKPLV